jgi:hypothetical protein
VRPAVQGREVRWLPNTGVSAVPEYLPRLVDPLFRELLADHPAILVVGPRACGKTTTGWRHCRGRLRLDRPAEAAVVRADPDAALADGPFPCWWMSGNWYRRCSARSSGLSMRGLPPAASS